MSAPVWYPEVAGETEPTCLIFLAELHPAVALNVRRMLLGLELKAVAEGSGVALQDVKKAHSSKGRQWPFVRLAQTKIANFYRGQEMQRGYRRAISGVQVDTTRADDGGVGGDDPHG